MRARLLFIVIVAVLIGGLAALNWTEITSTTRLNFGIFFAQASLAGILLATLALTLALFLVSSAVQESRNLKEWNRHSRELQVQRDLADRAEASRFTELRQHIDDNLRESRQRDVMAGSEFEKSMLQSQRELRAQLEQMNRTLVARLGELESRYPGDAAVPARDVAPADVRPAEARLGDVRPGDGRPNDVPPPRRRLNV